MDFVCSYCGKISKNHNSWRNHERLCKQNPSRQFTIFSFKNSENNPNFFKVKCEYCLKEFTRSNIKRHVKNCPLNPINIKNCPVCGKIIQGPDWRKKTTCSKACANTFFRSGQNNGNWKESHYRTTCFEFHKKECIICGENKIVEVHHLDGDRNNNDIDNLIPLCPTHHKYWHSKYRSLIEDRVLQYVEEFKK